MGRACALPFPFWSASAEGSGDSNASELSEDRFRIPGTTILAPGTGLRPSHGVSGAEPSPETKVTLLCAVGSGLLGT